MPRMTASLAIVIVNWNAGSALRECLESIAAADRDGLTLEQIVLVDNASDDDSLANCRGIDLPLKVIRNSQNAGFSRACNQGARITSANYLLFLNSDVRLSPRALAEAVAFLERRDAGGIGICGIRLTSPDGGPSTCAARLPRPGNLVAHSLALHLLSSRLFPPRFLSPAELTESRAVEQIMGAFFLVRRQVFEALGGFDERFFLYYEEVDFSARARNAGWTSYYLADVTATHVGGGCSRRVPAFRLFHSLNSRLAYAHKHFSALGCALVTAAALLAEPVARLVRACLLRSGGEVRHTLQAYSLLCRSMIGQPRPARDRQQQLAANRD